MVIHSYNHITREAEAGQPQILGQPGYNRNTRLAWAIRLSQKTREGESKEEREGRGKGGRREERKKRLWVSCYQGCKPTEAIQLTFVSVYVCAGIHLCVKYLETRGQP